MMRRVFIAAVLAFAASPALAGDFFGCLDAAVGDDLYPPGIRMLPPDVQAEVAARHGKGLSLAGFYNDPSLALARQDYGDADLGYARYRRHGPVVARY